MSEGGNPSRRPIRWTIVLLSLGICAALDAAAQNPASGVDQDANAYRALAAGDQAELARARSEGGDPARYARENPEAIYAAMGDERDVDILEFVLKSGANPNARRNPDFKGAPIFSNVADRDKVALLIEYGADVNARDHNGYTPLAHVLFSPGREYKVPQHPRPDQRVRVFSKLELVRLLLDSGAEINGTPGGLGYNGALGLTRREDSDVIGLLIERGASLKDSDHVPVDTTPVDRGPLTIAIQLDRDDLALALLQRDKELGANDTLALVEAARRGFSDVALALLKAGASPSAGDAEGTTPIGWAVRRNDKALVRALQRAGVNLPARPFKPKLDVGNLDRFGATAVDAIDQVALFDPDRFYLNWTVPKQEPAFAFYSNVAGQFEAIKCEQAAGFSILANANDQGSINVGRCRNEAKRVLDAANRAKTALLQVVNMLSGSVPKPEQLKSLGWEWQTINLKSGWEAYSFPLLMIGHGILWLDTVVLLDRSHDHAVIVQAELHQLCQRADGIPRQIRTPLCDDTRKALTDIALAMAQKS